MSFIFLLLSSLVLFPSPFTFSVVIVFMLVYVFYLLLLSFNLSVLLVFMLLIVYLGAVMVLIGYVCAVCPNTHYKHSEFLLFITLSSFFIFILVATNLLDSSSTGCFSVGIQLYSLFGFDCFILLVSCLFFVLLMVSCTFNSPKGPFRAL